MTEVFWFIIYLAIGAAAIFTVAFLGPVSILDYRLEETWDKGDGLTNVIYRIISPAICTTGVMFFGRRGPWAGLCDPALAQMDFDSCLLGGSTCS